MAIKKKIFFKEDYDISIGSCLRNITIYIKSPFYIFVYIQSLIEFFEKTESYLNTSAFVPFN